MLHPFLYLLCQPFYGIQGFLFYIILQFTGLAIQLSAMRTFNKARHRIHLRCIQYKQTTHNASTQEEVVLVNVEFAGGFQNLGTHVKRKQQLVTLK